VRRHLAGLAHRAGPSGAAIPTATASGGARTRATLIPDDPDVNETER
jgi:hypothetical protein